METLQLPMDRSFVRVGDLSKNETKVLYSLLKFPGDKDQEIHERIGMKKSTFSSIKLRLQKRRVFQALNVPSFPRLGFELFITKYGQLNRLTTIEERMRVAKTMLQEFAEEFYIASESNRAINLAISENYTEYDKNHSKFMQLYSLNNFLAENGMHIVPFPFEISTFHAFMDFKPMLERTLSIPPEYEKPLALPKEPKQEKPFSVAEAKVMLGLVRFPGRPDTYIAKKMNVSRNTVASAKKKFLEEELLYPKIIPNLKSLGYNLLVFIHKKFNPGSTVEDRVEATELVKKELTPFIYVSKDLEGIIVTAFRDYLDFNRTWGNVLKTFLKRDYIREEPLVYTLSIPNMTVIKSFDFLQLIEKRFASILGSEKYDLSSTDDPWEFKE